MDLVWIKFIILIDVIKIDYLPIIVYFY